MNILRRYCFRELAYPFGMSFFLFTFIFIVQNLVELADLLVNKGVSIFDVIFLLLLIIPSVIGFILPTAALASVLLVFGGFAQNNEITAMRASGIHLFRVMLPIMACAFLLSLLALFLVDQIQPKAEYYSRQIIRGMVLKRPTAYIEPRRFIKDFKDYILWVNEVKGNRLEGVTIFQSQGAKPTRTIMAEWGEVVPSQDEESFSLKLYNGTSDEPNPDDPSVLYKLNFKTFLLPDITIGKESTGKGKKTREMSIDELMYQLEHNPDIQKASAADQRKIRAEIHKKVSFSMASLVFVLIGLPAAVITRRGEAVVSFSIAGGVVALYYILFVWGTTMAVQGVMPIWISIWLPNFILGAVGLYLMRRSFLT